MITREEKTKSEKLGKSLKSDVPRSHWQIKDENRQHNDFRLFAVEKFSFLLFHFSAPRTEALGGVRRFGTV